MPTAVEYTPGDEGGQPSANNPGKADGVEIEHEGFSPGNADQVQIEHEGFKGGGKSSGPGGGGSPLRWGLLLPAVLIGIIVVALLFMPGSFIMGTFACQGNNTISGNGGISGNTVNGGSNAIGGAGGNNAAGDVNGIGGNGGTFTLTGGMLNGNLNGGTLTGNLGGAGGTFTINGGTLTGNFTGGVFNGQLNGGTLTNTLGGAGGTFTINGGMLNGGFTGGVFTGNMKTISGNGDIASGRRFDKPASGGGVFTGDLKGGTFTLNGGTFTINGGTLTFRGTMLMLNAGSFTLSGHTLTLLPPLLGSLNGLRMGLGMQPMSYQTDCSQPPQAGGQPNPTATSSGGGGQTKPGGGNVSTQAPAECTAGWLPASGCTCCGTTLTCADGTVAQFNPKCGVGGTGCKCVCPVGAMTCTDSCTGKSCVP